MARYRKRPVEIDAVRWWGKYNEPTEWPVWFRDAVDAHMLIPHPTQPLLFISTLEGGIHAESGDWIIRGVAGEIYPCKPHIFDITYDAT